MKIGQGSVFVGNGLNENGNITVKGGADGKAGMDVSGRRVADKRDGRAAGKSIDGRNLATALDPIAQKKARAQKQAMKVVGDAFAADREVTRGLDESREKIRQLQQQNGEDRKAIRDIEANREEFRKANGIAADSQEQKDLELLAKEKEAGFYGSNVQLSAEECKELERIKKNGLTQYQEESLAMKEDERYYADRIGKAQQEIQTHNAIITGTKLEMLKHHGMIDAQKEAEQVMDQASKDIVSMLVAEGKEHVEEEFEEKVEQTKEEAEQREKLQEKVDAAKERREEREEITEEILENAKGPKSGSSGIGAAQQEVKDMIQKMKLIEEDIKGAVVDQNL